LLTSSPALIALVVIILSWHFAALSLNLELGEQEWFAAAASMKSPASKTIYHIADSRAKRGSE
jgi:hypothetical protein